MTGQLKSVEAVFNAARELPPAQRAAYLDCSCKGDSVLRERVEALLEADADAGSFLNQPLAAVDATSIDLAGETDGEHSGEWVAKLGFLAPCDTPGRLGTLRGKAGEYDLIELIGRGGMGAVWRAFDTKLNRIVAVKVMAPELAGNPTAVKRFLREAQAAAGVHHDHVVTIFAVDEEHQPPFLVMEYVEGQTLGTKIDNSGALELIPILRIGSQIAAGLAAAHQLGLIHRDVKPNNILLQNSVERVKITDFGLARAVDDVEMTTPGLVSGTPLYMSPEQAQGVPIDTRSDLFSMGSVLYAMCTGRPAFRAESTLSVLRRVCDDTPRPIREVNPEIPDWLETIIDKLLAKSAADRFQSATEVAELLNRHLAHEHDPAHWPRPATVAVSPWALSAGVPTLHVGERAASRPRGWSLSATIVLVAILMITAGLTASFRSGLAELWPVPRASNHDLNSAPPAPMVNTPLKEPARDESGFRAGSVWSGSRTYLKGQWQGKTVTYYLHIRECNGTSFSGHVFDNGANRNRAEVTGEVHGDSVTWREQTQIPDEHVDVAGKIVGNAIRLTHTRRRTNGTVLTEGDGELVSTDD